MYVYICSRYLVYSEVIRRRRVKNYRRLNIPRIIKHSQGRNKGKEFLLFVYLCLKDLLQPLKENIGYRGEHGS